MCYQHFLVINRSPSEVSRRGGERADVQPPAEAGERQPDPAEDGGGAPSSS